MTWGATILAQALHHNTTLTALHFGYNLTHDNRAQALAHPLESNCSLSELDLSQNAINALGVHCGCAPKQEHSLRAKPKKP